MGGGGEYLAQVQPQGVKQSIEHHEEEQKQENGQEVPGHHAVVADVLQGARARDHRLQKHTTLGMHVRSGTSHIIPEQDYCGCVGSNPM